ncbi:hypothetical protein [Peribacillus sp. NPDC097895]|uniref:hypothetical protein n=1 Tax=Peribacillus sp. NPDC097895 TaxID=3390619 RepID=UPI003D07D3BD
MLGRWKEYAINGHGNNTKLKELIEADPQRIHTIKYTILQTLQRTLTQNEVLGEEGKYKKINLEQELMA